MKKIIASIREPVNGLTHGIGAILSLIGLVLLLIEALEIGSVSHILAFSIFGSSMVLLYTSSSLYHSLNVKERTLGWLQKLDHSMIYVLIAGTYTPVCLLVLEDTWGWTMFGIIWSLAVVGIIIKLTWFDAPRWLSTAFYLGLGWLAVLIFPQMIELASVEFMIWIAIGGAAYTIGAIIYGTKKPDPLPKVFGFHEIWHLFVMAGTFSHFWAIYDHISIVG
ncbi:MAG: PAQR family membrane homeostasis protein TrhA [Bacteroidota bacterium]